MVQYCVITSFRHKGLAALYEEDNPRGVKQSLVKRLRQILALLATAKTVEDMNLPGLRLHALKGDRAGFYAVSVSGNWRVIFRLRNGQATDVDLVDYH
jgi:proteic killer suppression protein